MLKKIITIAAIATAATVTTVSAGNLLNPQEPDFKVTKAQLAIKSPIVNVCPTPAKMTGWIFTNQEGEFQYMIARKGGTVSGPFTAQSEKGANGLYMASFSKTFDVHHKIDAEYRILVGEKYGKTLSNWAPLQASCKIQLGG